MKKLLFVLGLVMMSMTVMAQEEKSEQSAQSELPDGVLALEWKFNPFDYESKPVKVAEVTARLFLNNQSAIRIGVGVGFDRDKDEKNTTTSTSSTNSTLINNALTLKAGVGYEYHFANTGRLDFYAGGEAGYLGHFYSATEESTKNEVQNDITTITTTNSEYEKRNLDGDKFNEHGIFGTVFTGIDFYIYKKLYLGAELGLTFNYGSKSNGTYTTMTDVREIFNDNIISQSISKYSSETGITTTTTSTTQGTAIETKGNHMKVYLEPAIRIGWIF